MFHPTTEQTVVTLSTDSTNNEQPLFDSLCYEQIGWKKHKKQMINADAKPF